MEEKQKPKQKDNKSEKKSEEKGNAKGEASKRIVDACRKHGSKKVVYTLESNGERTIATSRHARQKYPERVIEFLNPALF